MLDRILYILASPLAREIIDSLRTEPGEWHEHDILPELSGGMRGYRIWMPAIGKRVEVRDENCTWQAQGPISRLALRRAVNKWRKENG